MLVDCHILSVHWEALRLTLTPAEKISVDRCDVAGIMQGRVFAPTLGEHISMCRWFKGLVQGQL